MKTLLILFLGLIASPATAQEYPARPVRVVVPYVAGGNADIWARTLAQKLTENLKQAFVVENKPGANGGICTDFGAKGAAAGVSLLSAAVGPVRVHSLPYA